MRWLIPAYVTGVVLVTALAFWMVTSGDHEVMEEHAGHGCEHERSAQQNQRNFERLSDQFGGLPVVCLMLGMMWPMLLAYSLSKPWDRH